MLSQNHRKTTSAMALDELKRREDLESLRKYLVSESCFPTQKDPMTGVITMEELKKLARVWKLNERRNFWKTHTEREEMVAALLEHIEDNQKILSKKLTMAKNYNRNETPEVPGAGNNFGSPTPPKEVKPSYSSGRIGSLTDVEFRNYCGLKYFNRENNSTELVINSRFYSFPDTGSTVDSMVNNWRTDDFHLKDSTASLDSLSSSSNSPRRYSTVNIKDTSKAAVARNNARLEKHRNLAAHLVNYSASTDFYKAHMNLSSVQTFLNICDTDDPRIVSNCVIAISNIAAFENVRSLLFEINAVHKFTNLVTNIKGKQAAWAASLLFYYFSCDTETEDRVYTAGTAFLVLAGQSGSETRLVTLHTLSNLMPCIDRQRVVENAMRVIHSNFNGETTLQDSTLLQTYLLVILNMAAFYNAHAALLSFDVIGLLKEIATYALKRKNADIGTSVAKIIDAFIHPLDQLTTTVDSNLTSIICLLLNIESPNLQFQCVRACVLLSTVQQLREVIATTELTKVICSIVIETESLGSISMSEKINYVPGKASVDDSSLLISPSMNSHSAALYKEVSKFLVNISLDSDDDKLRKLVADGAHKATLSIMKNKDVLVEIKRIAVVSMQNLLSCKNNALKLTNKSLDILLNFIKQDNNINAAFALYNISCNPECRADLVENKVHLQMLESFSSTKEHAIKSAFLQVLVQMSSSNVCVMELLSVGLIAKLESQIRRASTVKESINNKNDIWKDISLMLLAVVAYAADDLLEEDQIKIVRILRIVCTDTSSTSASYGPVIEATDYTIPVDIIENCANVLKFISIKYNDFEELDTVVRTILTLTDNEEVVAQMSCVLYNMTCSAKNIPLMLTDGTYINFMIQIMRKGKVEVQENIAQAIRTLCSDPKSPQLLLKKDILSDLIVIALLRTSSEEIKIVCSQAFYNMLCHEPTRLRLLEGDLWWALMRLCRADSNEVRNICARALFDLSIDPANVKPLRNHHILSFIKDICASGDEKFLSTCLDAVHNLLHQFAEDVFSANEVSSSIIIGAEALRRCSSTKNIRSAIVVLLVCAQQQADIVEFVHIDIVQILHKTKNRWTNDNNSRLNISRLIWELSKNKFFTKSTSVSDIDAILCSTFSLNAANNTTSKLSSNDDVRDNVAAAILQFIQGQEIEAEELIDLKIWKLLLQETFHNKAMTTIRPGSGINLSTRRASVAPSTSPRGSLPMKQRSSDAGMVALVSSNRLPLSRNNSHGESVTRSISNEDHNGDVKDTRATVLSLLAFCIKKMILSKTAKACLTRAVITSLLNIELLTDPISKTNLLYVLQVISSDSELSIPTVESGVFQLLHTFVTFSAGNRSYLEAQEFAALFLRNISLHPILVKNIVATTDGKLNALVKELLELPNDKVSLDLGVLFCNAANHLIKSDNTALNPKFVLDMIGMVTNIEGKDDDDESPEKPHANSATEKELIENYNEVNKYTVSTILNKFTFGSGVNPTFVQSMFSYLQNNNSSVTLPQYMENITYKEMADLDMYLYFEYLASKQSDIVEFEEFNADGDEWKPFVIQARKQMENIILKFSRAQAVCNKQHESNDQLPAAIFTKIVKRYEPIREPGLSATDGEAVIAEGDEDEDEDEEVEKVQHHHHHHDKGGKGAEDSQSEVNPPSSAERAKARKTKSPGNQEQRPDSRNTANSTATAAESEKANVNSSSRKLETEEKPEVDVGPRN